LHALLCVDDDGRQMCCFVHVQLTAAVNSFDVIGMQRAALTLVCVERRVCIKCTHACQTAVAPDSGKCMIAALVA
jgi:hypothetical protein